MQLSQSLILYGIALCCWYFLSIDYVPSAEGNMFAASNVICVQFRGAREHAAPRQSSCSRHTGHSSPSSYVILLAMVPLLLAVGFTNRVSGRKTEKEWSNILKQQTKVCYMSLFISAHAATLYPVVVPTHTVWQEDAQHTRQEDHQRDVEGLFPKCWAACSDSTFSRTKENEDNMTIVWLARARVCASLLCFFFFFFFYRGDHFRDTKWRQSTKSIGLFLPWLLLL